MNKIAIWLDDERPMPQGFTHHAKTAQEAIDLLKTETVVYIDLDYDLGYGQPTGLEVANFIAEGAKNGTLNNMIIGLHTHSIGGRKELSHVLRQAKEIWLKKTPTKETENGMDA